MTQGDVVLKLITFGKRRAGLSPEGFQRYWRTRHAELVRSVPGLRRYVQNHTLLSVYERREPAADGVAELWFDDEVCLRQGLGSAQMAAVRADELRLLDRTSQGSLVASEHTVMDGLAPVDAVKQISLLTRRRDLSVAAFQSYWREKHAPVASAIPGMRRYVQCHALPSTYSEGPIPTRDGVPIAWFDDTAALRAAADSEAFAATMADNANFLEPDLPFVLAREHVVSP